MIRVNYKINEEEKKTLLEMHTKKGYKTIVESEDDIEDFDSLDFNDNEEGGYEELDFVSDHEDDHDHSDLCRHCNGMGYDDFSGDDCEFCGGSGKEHSKEMDDDHSDYEIVRMDSDEIEEMYEEDGMSADDFKNIYGEKDEISLAENHIKKIVKKVLNG